MLRNRANVEPSDQSCRPCLPRVAGLLPPLAAQARGDVYRCTTPDGNKVYIDVVIKGQPCERIEFGPAPRGPALPDPIRPVGIGRAKKIVADGMRDPEATRFRDVRRGRSGKVCGLVNAKNAMGGYVGYTEFVVLGVDYAYVHDRSTGNASGTTYAKYCGK